MAGGCSGARFRSALINEDTRILFWEAKWSLDVYLRVGLLEHGMQRAIIL